jgi:hypothetical protein
MSGDGVGQQCESVVPTRFAAETIALPTGLKLTHRAFCIAEDPDVEFFEWHRWMGLDPPRLHVGGQVGMLSFHEVRVLLGELGVRGFDGPAARGMAPDPGNEVEPLVRDALVGWIGFGWPSHRFDNQLLHRLRRRVRDGGGDEFEHLGA